ncbi:MAG: ABC transporter permease [Anaerolineae bacterium]|nr:ABC transporter permease [Anaerolineae bacterium]
MKFSLRRFQAILIKEYRHILRAPRTLLLVILSPAFLLVLLANLFSVEAQRARFVLWDLDNSVHSRRYLAALTADGDFHLNGNIYTYDEIAPELRSGRADFVLIIPHGFGRSLIVGAPAEIQAIFDATDAIRTPQLQGYLMARSGAFSGAVLLKGQDLQGNPLELRAVHWYNPAMNSKISMVPALIPIVLSMPALAYGLSIARERELGSFEGLITTPVQGIEYLFGKSLAYISLGLLSVLVNWLVATLGFHIPFRGSFLLYMGLSALYLAATIGLVTAASPILKTQQVAFFVVLAYFFVPSFFTSGLLMPILSEGWGRLSSDIFPATHFVTIARSIFVKGLGFTALLRPTIFLAGMYIGGMIIAVLTFRKRLM